MVKMAKSTPFFLVFLSVLIANTQARGGLMSDQCQHTLLFRVSTASIMVYFHFCWADARSE